jgi:two-component system response regulator MprA
MRSDRCDNPTNVAPAASVLIVDDDPGVLDAIARALTLRGFAVRTAVDGDDAIAALLVSAPDVVVLDVAMPTIDGLDVCRRLRASGERTPILIVSARDAIADRVAGLDAGADDYLVKPFALDELTARVRALVRRSASSGRAETLRFEDVEFDRAGFTARRAGVVLDLTRLEARLLEVFLENPRRVMTQDVLLQAVWGYSIDYASNTLQVHVSNLRRKMEHGGGTRLIATVRGIGYALRPE